MMYSSKLFCDDCVHYIIMSYENNVECHPNTLLFNIEFMWL